MNDLVNLKTVHFLKMAKKKMIENGEKDSMYAISKRLGISQQSLSRYMNHRGAMDDKTAVIIANFLELDPMQVIAAVNAERAINKDDKQFWKTFQSFGHVTMPNNMGVLVSTVLVINTVKEYILCQIEWLIYEHPCKPSLTHIRAI